MHQPGSLRSGQETNLGLGIAGAINDQVEYIGAWYMLKEGSDIAVGWRTCQDGEVAQSIVEHPAVFVTITCNAVGHGATHNRTRPDILRARGQT